LFAFEDGQRFVGLRGNKNFVARRLQEILREIANEIEVRQIAASPIASGRILSARTRPATPFVFICLSGGGGSLRSARTEERPSSAI